MSSPKPFQFEKMFYFTRLHRPTGSVSAGTVWCYNEKDFLEKMTKWNGQAPELWLYAPSPMRGDL